MTSDPVAQTTEQCELGEGVRWDDRRDELLRVDILAGRIYRDMITDAGALVPVRSYRVPETVGAIAPVDNDEGWLLATEQGFSYLRPDGTLQPIAEVAPEDTRMNDAACDPQGRFWAGTVADDQRPRGGALYRLDRDGETDLIISGLTISNGLGWSPDGRTMYLADSGPGVVYAFKFDAEQGTIFDNRVLVDVPKEVGSPDGLTVDAEGDLWVAIFGGGRIQRYSPEGHLREEFLIPAEQTTCCAFGGPGLHRLYVTTATEHWTDEQRRAEPGAGLVYAFDTDATGQPAAPFRPDPTWWSTVSSGAA
jgi:sugar lactone lactonase YvrE